jgi:hypothetical protein
VPILPMNYFVNPPTKGGKTYTSIRLITNREQPLKKLLAAHIDGFLQAKWFFLLQLIHD